MDTVELYRHWCATESGYTGEQLDNAVARYVAYRTLETLDATGIAAGGLSGMWLILFVGMVLSVCDYDTYKPLYDYYRDVCGYSVDETETRLLQRACTLTPETPQYPNGRTPYRTTSYTSPVMRDVRPLPTSTREHTPDVPQRLTDIMLGDGVTVLPLENSIGDAMRFYQSQALRVYVSCLNAGIRGGLAAYLHACEQAGLVGLLPDTAQDKTPRQLASLLAEVAPDVTSDSYLRYWAEVHTAGLVQDNGKLRNAAFTGLFTSVLERVLVAHNCQTFYPVLRDMVKLFKDGASGRLGLPVGTWMGHVYVSLQHACLQAWCLYDDTGIYQDIEVDGEVLPIGAQRYRLAIEELDAREERGKAYHRAMYQSECPIVRLPKHSQAKRQNSNLAAKRRRLRK